MLGLEEQSLTLLLILSEKLSFANLGDCLCPYVVIFISRFITNLDDSINNIACFIGYDRWTVLWIIDLVVPRVNCKKVYIGKLVLHFDYT